MKFMVLMYADPATTASMTPPNAPTSSPATRHCTPTSPPPARCWNSAGLAFPADTMTLRWQPDAAPAVVEGPIAAAAQSVTAYYVLECENAERAHEIAARVLDFHVVAVEVRPIHDWFGMDDAAPEARG